MSAVKWPAPSLCVTEQALGDEQRLREMQESTAKAAASVSGEINPCFNPSNTLDSALARLHHKTAEISRQAEKNRAETPQQLFLPGFDMVPRRFVWNLTARIHRSGARWGLWATRQSELSTNPPGGAFC